MLLIELAVPVEKIPYIRTIEGRRFRNGLWSFPESSANTLKQIGLLDEEYIVEEKGYKTYIKRMLNVERINFDLQMHRYVKTLDK